MQAPTITTFDPRNPRAYLHLPRPTAYLLSHLRPYADVYCTVVPADQHGWAELLLWLPGTSDAALNSMACQRADLMNYSSADLLSSRTLMCFRASDIEVRVDMWLLNKRILSTGKETGFGVVFMNENTALYAEHHFSPEEMENFVDVMQAQMICSGPNYNPVRIWGDTCLDEHAGKENDVEPGVIVPPCLSWTLPVDA